MPGDSFAETRHKTLLTSPLNAEQRKQWHQTLATHDYVGVAKAYADFMIEHGRNAYDKKHTRTFYWKFTSGSAVRSGDWKLIRGKKGKPELYDIAKDPYEKNNVAAQHPERVKELKALLATCASRDRNSKPVRKER